MATIAPSSRLPAPLRARSTTERIVLGLEAFLALGAYGGAIALMADTIDLAEATAKLPFGGSTLFAGAALGLLIGVLPTVVLVAALRRRPWAPWGHVLVGAVLTGWIVVQVLVLGPPVAALQLIYLVYGLVILALALRLVRTASRPSA
jgi:hypothetical protein